MQCVAVIQARRQSSRLPDKVLLPLAGMPVIQHVIERCKRIEGVDRVICAIPEAPFNDVLEEVAIEAGAAVFRGSETDVLQRYYQAVENLDTKYVMRVTSDCPLLDPEVCGELLKGVTHAGAEYGGTAWWPHGLDCEVFTKGLLKEAFETASHTLDREHVTLWMKRKYPEVFLLKAKENLTRSNRWVLDYPEDYIFFTALAELLTTSLIDVGWQQVLEIVHDNPSIKENNAQCAKHWYAATREIYDETAKE